MFKSNSSNNIAAKISGNESTTQETSCDSKTVVHETRTSNNDLTAIPTTEELWGMLRVIQAQIDADAKAQKAQAKAQAKAQKAQSDACSTRLDALSAQLKRQDARIQEIDEGLEDL